VFEPSTSKAGAHTDVNVYASWGAGGHSGRRSGSPVPHFCYYLFMRTSLSFCSLCLPSERYSRLPLNYYFPFSGVATLFKNLLSAIFIPPLKQSRRRRGLGWDRGNLLCNIFNIYMATTHWHTNHQQAAGEQNQPKGNKTKARRTQGT